MPKPAVKRARFEAVKRNLMSRGLLPKDASHDPKTVRALLNSNPMKRIGGSRYSEVESTLLKFSKELEALRQLKSYEKSNPVGMTKGRENEIYLKEWDLVNAIKLLRSHKRSLMKKQNSP